MRAGSRAFYRITKPLLFALCLLPFARLALGAFGIAGVSLGANPIEEILDTCGQWAIRFLLITLAVTPLRLWTGWTWLLAYRRMLGLFAFFYVLMHFSTYLFLDLRLDWAHVVNDIAEHPYILVGFLGFLGLLPLAITSTRGFQRRLGRRWQTLHRAVYGVAVLAIWHYWWQVKLDALQAAIYAAVLAVLFGARWWAARRKRARVAARRAAAGQSA